MKQIISGSSSFLPNYTAQSIHDINFKHLKKKGVLACFFDLDHTILDRGTTTVNTDIINRLKSMGLKIYIATNRQYTDNLYAIAQQISAEGIMYSEKGGTFKPRRIYYRKLILLAGLKPEQIAMVGDRLIQDIYGANRAGLHSVLVAKLGPISFIDRIMTIPDILLPKIFAKRYKDV